MLKITTQRQGGVWIVGLEGRLAGPWVKELETCWRTAGGAESSAALRVDLSSVTFVDEEGKGLLKKMVREGAELIAEGCLNRCIAEGIMHSVKRKR